MMINFSLNQNTGKGMINQPQLNIDYMESLIIMVVSQEVITQPLQLITKNGINLMIAMLVKFKLEALSRVLLIYFSTKEFNEKHDMCLRFII